MEGQSLDGSGGDRLGDVQVVAGVAEQHPHGRLAHAAWD
jgi:hypothetical protein